MKTRSILMTLALLIAGWLAFFGDKTGSSDIAEPVVRSSASALAAAKTARATPAASTPATSASPLFKEQQPEPEPVIAALLPRDFLMESTETPPSATAKPTNQAKVDPKAKAQASASPPPATVAVTMSDPIFGVQNWTPPPPPPPKPLPPPPPTAPPLPFTYLGKKSEDQIWEVYLARGEKTYIVREKSLIEQEYRIDSIKPPTLTLTYLPLNQVQSLTIGGTD